MARLRSAYHPKLQELAVSDASDQAKDFIIKLKVPQPAWDLMVALAAQLRADPAFLPRLQLFVDDYQRPSLAAAFEKVAERLERMETHVTSLAKDMRAVQTKIGNGKLPEWITGQGNRVRLTPQGEEEVNRLFAEGGLSDVDIAIRIGVSAAAIHGRRRKHDRSTFEQSLRTATT
jgi:hypothetical protein